MDELAERDARGDVAAIYEEIRRFWAVPYVSSMQRHLATRPGWLEWVWAARRVRGAAPSATHPPMPPPTARQACTAALASTTSKRQRPSLDLRMARTTSGIGSPVMVLRHAGG